MEKEGESLRQSQKTRHESDSREKREANKEWRGKRLAKEDSIGRRMKSIRRNISAIRCRPWWKNYSKGFVNGNWIRNARAERHQIIRKWHHSRNLLNAIEQNEIHACYKCAVELSKLSSILFAKHLRSALEKYFWWTKDWQLHHLTFRCFLFCCCTTRRCFLNCYRKGRKEPKKRKGWRRRVQAWTRIQGRG